MRRAVAIIAFAAAVVTLSASLLISSKSSPATPTTYLGFDRNDYPGDDALKLLRHTFSFAGFWLNNPPGASSNSWSGKRASVEAAGFGFLVVFNGHTYKEIKAAGDATNLGIADGKMAAASARREGFPAGTLIFLDQEEGGRLLPEQRAYVHAWADAVQSAGFRAGVYCSGIAFTEEPGTTVITAEDIRENAGGRQLAYWVANDSCPPSPGCAFPSKLPRPGSSGVPFAEVWQFAQSPRRPEFTSGCPANYSNDGNCYPPGHEFERLYVDVNVATSSDPSHGRTR